VLLVLLVFAAVNVYRKRNQGEPPKWMGELQEAKPNAAFKLGFLLLGVFPTDIATSIAVGTRIARQGDPLVAHAGLHCADRAFLAIPANLVVVMGSRAQAFLPAGNPWSSAADLPDPDWWAPQPVQRTQPASERHARPRQAKAD
jgi:Sap, sulfolipid-1-addressing protein